MKKYLISLFMIICLVICVFSILKISTKPQSTTIITTLSIQDVTEKSHTDDYYLRLLLDDFVVEEYALTYNSLIIKTTESIYNNVDVNSGFVGVSLEITIPSNQEKRDVGMILKENLTDGCKIIGITTKSNEIIN